jgi:uncharacterized protein (DUF2267 family)
MSITGLEVLDSTVHQTNAWLKALMGRLGTDDRHRAYVALRLGLHALRDRLTPEMAVHLGAQLPILVRGLYYEDWRMAATPTRVRHADAFLDQLRAVRRSDPELDPEAVVRAVFAVLSEQLDPGEIAKVIGVLPKELRAFWPEAAGRRADVP